MEEKEGQGNWKGESSGEEFKESPSIEIDVTIHNVHKGKISVPKGSTLKDVLDMIGKQFNVNTSEYRIFLDGKVIDFTKENPVLTSNSTLALIKKIVGG